MSCDIEIKETKNTWNGKVKKCYCRTHNIGFRTNRSQPETCIKQKISTDSFSGDDNQ